MFEKLGDLCSVPAVAQQVIQVANNPDSDSEDLLHVVEQDTALSTRVMQVVNSAYCGLRSPVGDLKSAITLLGNERVRNLSLTVSLGCMASSEARPGRMDPERLWDHSVCVATVCRLIAKKGDFCDPEEAYLAGLLHDVGLLFINEHLSKLVPRVLELLESGVSLPEAERRVLAFDHAQVGAYIAWRAHFPDHLVAAIDYHHAPLSCPEEGRNLARVVSVGNYLATRYGRGSIVGRRLPAPPEGVLQPMGLNLQAFRHLWAEMPESMSQVAHVTGA